MANLASMYRNQGRWEEAEELQAKDFGTCTRVLGAEHPDTLVSMNNLAFIWKDIGCHGDALGLLQTCFGLQQQVLGEGHPSTVSTLSAVEAWLRATGSVIVLITAMNNASIGFLFSCYCPKSVVAQWQDEAQPLARGGMDILVAILAPGSGQQGSEALCWTVLNI
jgi:hypothetical protein